MLCRRMTHRGAAGPQTRPVCHVWEQHFGRVNDAALRRRYEVTRILYRFTGSDRAYVLPSSTHLAS